MLTSFFDAAWAKGSGASLESTLGSLVTALSGSWLVAPVAPAEVTKLALFFPHNLFKPSNLLTGYFVLQKILLLARLL